jgi:hypothetical protein
MTLRESESEDGKMRGGEGRGGEKEGLVKHTWNSRSSSLLANLGYGINAMSVKHPHATYD